MKVSLDPCVYRSHRGDGGGGISHAAVVDIFREDDLISELGKDLNDGRERRKARWEEADARECEFIIPPVSVCPRGCV